MFSFLILTQIISNVQVISSTLTFAHMNYKSIISDVKEAIRYLWSPLLILWIAFSLLIILSSCTPGDEPNKKSDTFTTIKDLNY
jgi:O-antigen ligase